MRISRIGVGVLSAGLIGAGALIVGVPPVASLVREASAAGERYTVQDAWPGVTFATPVAVAAPRDGTDRVFVVERAGRIKVGKKFRGAGAVPAPTLFLDISALQMPSDKLEEGHGGLVNLAAREAFMLVMGPLAVRRGVVLHINWPGRWSCWASRSSSTR